MVGWWNDGMRVNHERATIPPIHHPTNPPIHQSTNPPIHQSTNPPIHHPTNPLFHIPRPCEALHKRLCDAVVEALVPADRAALLLHVSRDLARIVVAVRRIRSAHAAI